MHLVVPLALCYACLAVVVTRRFCLQAVMDQSRNGSYESPRPPSRGGNPEARENAEKGRGLMSQIMDRSGSNGLNTPRSPSRVSAREATENAQRGRGVMSQVMQSSRAEDATSRPSSRLRTERIADGPADAMSRVRPEARDNYERNRGLTTSLYYNYGKLPMSSRPAPRIRAEGEECAVRNKGTMNNIIHSYGKQPLSARPMPRVKPEAQQNALVGRGTVAGILGQSGPDSGDTS